MDADYIWTPPQYDVSHAPLETRKVSLPAPADSNGAKDFIRTIKWCPDGSTAIAQSENRDFHFLTFPPDMLQNRVTDQENSYFTKKLPQPAAILEFAWYPQATVQNPATFCFIASVRDTPVRLVDANDGRLRASYRIVDHRERQVAPHSIAFNLAADKLYCGYDSAVEIFDVNRPGEGTRILTSPSKKSRDGMKGIISALSFCPSASDFYAAGTLTPTPAPIALYDAASDEPVMYLGLTDSERKGNGGGVTQLRFNPMKPHLLYGSFRRCGHIYTWDMRQAAGEPICKYRFVKSDSESQHKMTNQRLRFDVDIGGRWLSVGNQDGDISMFDLDVEGEPVNSDGPPEILPTLVFRAHEDAIGSVSFHPLEPVLLSASGSRHFDLPATSIAQRSPDLTDSDSGGEDADTKRPRVPCPIDASIKLWAFNSV